MPTSTPIAFLDLPWVLMDTAQHPMHVGALFILQAPADSPPGYVAQWVAGMREHNRATRPFDRRLDRKGLRLLWPSWVDVGEIDLDHHLRHSALPFPGGERELGVLVSRLHRTQLDLTKPLWELHVIEGLHDDRFAIYIKVHHSVMDGVAAVRTLQAAFTTDPTRRDMPPPWAFERPPRSTAAIRSRTRLQTVRDVVSAAVATLGRRRTRPYSAPPSLLNGPITPQRRIATQTLELARLRNLADELGGTVNDALLAVCSGALRRYLTDLGELPGESLVAAMPVAVRRDADDTVDDRANALSFMFATLGTDLDNVRDRIETIKSSVQDAKRHLEAIPRSAIDIYTTLTMSRFTLAQIAGLRPHGRPMFNILISNVPGPRSRLYYNGAEVVGLYPVSVLQTGQALNITAVSYDGELNVAFTACATTLPHVQRLAVDLLDSLAELEKVYVNK